MGISDRGFESYFWGAGVTTWEQLTLEHFWGVWKKVEACVAEQLTPQTLDLEVSVLQASPIALFP